MQIIETFSLGKKNKDELNEDRIVITDDFAVVMDGVTTKSCPEINGKSGGRFAVDCGEAIIKTFKKDITAREAVDILTDGLAKEVARYVQLEKDIDKPAFALIIYSKHRKEIWRVADPFLMIDGKDYSKHLKLDEIFAAVWSLFIEISLMKGAKPEDILKDDIGRNFIKPLISQGYLFCNNTDSEYGHGVVNGDKVPDKFLEIIDASDAKEIVIASDGYPQIFPTLRESEEFLKNVLSNDRLLYKQYKTTKCVVDGNISFDDRSYVRFKV